MAEHNETLRRIFCGRGSISFRDVERVLRKLGFEQVRMRGSHRIYRHPSVPRHLTLQPVGHEAKPYQIRQLRNMIVEFNLTIERCK